MAQEDLTKLAVEVRKLLRIPAVIFLQGEVGIGKTTFCRFLFTGASSPTYSIVNLYPDGAHADFFRLKDRSEIIHLELGRYGEVASLFALEWGISYIEDIFRELGGGFNYYQLEISKGKTGLLRNFILEEIFLD
jgi:tRNA threonylcarbamoyladenosine biosynthesis protein TsaE